MQMQLPQSQNNETPAAVHTPTRQPWVKPIFQKVALNDALTTFSGNWNDIAGTMMEEINS